MKAAFVTLLALASSASACLHYYGRVNLASTEGHGGIELAVVEDNGKVVCNDKWGYQQPGGDNNLHAHWHVNCLDGYDLFMDWDGSNFDYTGPYGQSRLPNTIYRNGETNSWDTRAYC